MILAKNVAITHTDPTGATKNLTRIPLAAGTTPPTYPGWQVDVTDGEVYLTA